MTAERPACGSWQKLREARERKGVSLRQIANTTKIAVAVLDGLERNDISKLPGGIFGRAFVRSFATEVGLDPEATIQEFIAQFRDDSVAAGHPPSEQIEDNGALESTRRRARTLLGVDRARHSCRGGRHLLRTGWPSRSVARDPARSTRIRLDDGECRAHRHSRRVVDASTCATACRRRRHAVADRE